MHRKSKESSDHLAQTPDSSSKLFTSQDGDVQLPGAAKKLLLTVKEVAYLLSLSERTVWTRSGTGELPRPITIGRSKRWVRKEIENFLEDLTGKKAG